MSEEFVSFLGWATLIHCVLLTVIALVLVFLGDWSSRLHQRMFGIEAAEAKVIYFKFVAYYEVLVIVFFAVPWVVLRYLV